MKAKKFLQFVNKKIKNSFSLQPSNSQRLMKSCENGKKIPVFLHDANVKIVILLENFFISNEVSVAVVNILGTGWGLRLE